MVLILACLLGLAGTSLSLVALGMNQPNVAALAVATAMIGVCLAALYRHARRDPATAVGLTGSGALGAAVLAVAMVTLGDRPHALTYVVAGSTSLMALAAIAWFVRAHRRPDPLPNPLRAHFAAGSIRELDGVQFVIATGDTEVRPGGALPVVVLAQNGWDSDRYFTLSLVPERRLALDQGRFLVPPPARVRLPPGACAEVVVVAVAPLSPVGRHPLLVLPGVQGEGGARVRHWRAATYEAPVSPAFTLLGALGGMVFTGGGLRVQATVVGVATGESHTADTRSTLVYEPPPELVAEARA